MKKNLIKSTISFVFMILTFAPAFGYFENVVAYTDVSSNKKMFFIGLHVTSSSPQGNGSGNCRTGFEVTLRVIPFEDPKNFFEKLIHSCIESIDLAGPDGQSLRGASHIVDIMSSLDIDKDLIKLKWISINRRRASGTIDLKSGIPVYTEKIDGTDL